MVNPGTYWKKPDRLVLRREYWEDPEPRVCGILSADRIQYYSKLLRMIEPFHEENLKPASYSLTLGPLYQIEGKDGVLRGKNPILEIPPNSIAFVSMEQQLMIPHYIVARFDLKVDLVYWGLLLGTGPQVDPGFQGVLSCPFHNISSNPIRLKLGEHVATIEFIKTTPFAEQASSLFSDAQNEEDLYKQEKDLVGKDRFPNRLFPMKKRWLRPILDYPPGNVLVSSSVAPLARTVNTWRIAGYAGLIVFVALVVALIQLNVNSLGIWRATQADKGQILDTLRQVRVLQKEEEKTKDEIDKRLREIQTILDKLRQRKP